MRVYKASGYNLLLVQKQLGHSTVTITQVYADVLDADVDQALANLDLDDEKSHGSILSQDLVIGEI